MKYLLLLMLTTVVCPGAWSKDRQELPAIPDSLRRHAHAVIRYDTTEMHVEALDEVYYRRKYALTVLDERGKDQARLQEGYNNLVRIDKIRGRLLDAAGNELKVLKEKDIHDQSTFGSGFVYHSDNRIRHYQFDHHTYPFTVEYEIIEKIKTTFFLPGWHVQPRPDCAVISSYFSLSAPSGSGVRYKEHMLPPGRQYREVKDDKGNVVSTWLVHGVSAFQEQPGSRTGNYSSPVVTLSPVTFALLKYKGSMQSWQSLGLFMYELNKDRDQLPEDKKKLVHQLVDTLRNDYDKVQQLYSYMQQTTRYVANEYGIAGWQTFDAESVARNGYGDCKGLTNYLKALLKEAGIRSYTTLVYAGDDYYKLDEQFPANNFNHVILCVPQARDSIWIECTSQQLPAGYLGSFTRGRQVLLVTEQGGFLCRTPDYGKEQSFVVRKGSLRFDPAAAQQKVVLHNLYSGLLQDDISQFVKTQSGDKVRDMLNARFAFPSYSVGHYRYQPAGTPLLPALEEQVEAMVGGIVSSTQKRTFLNIAWMRNPMPELYQSMPRTLPIVLDESFRITDTLEIQLPAGMAVESLPRPVEYQYPFATYRLRFMQQGDKIDMIRSYEQNQGIYDAATYEKYQQLYQAINAEKEKLSIVLLNKAS